MPSVATAANLLTVRPPPQPISRILKYFWTEMCERPQSVTPECLAFIFRRTSRPSQPTGFWHCVTRGFVLGVVFMRSAESRCYYSRQSRERRCWHLTANPDVIPVLVNFLCIGSSWETNRPERARREWRYCISVRSSPNSTRKAPDSLLSGFSPGSREAPVLCGVTPSAP